MALLERIGSFNHHDRLASLHLWLASVLDPDRGYVVGHDVYAEARFNEMEERDHPYLEAIMCGGMTDFSGEGGTGYENLRAIFAFLSQLLGVPLHFHHLEDAGGVYSHISIAIEEAHAEENAYPDEPSYP